MMDKQEFQTLYETFAKRLVKYGIYYGVELEIFKELTHQAYHLLLSNHDKILKRHNNLAGWLIKTIHNLVHWELASNRSKYEVPMPKGFEPPSLTEYKTQRGLSERKLAEELNVGLGTIQNCLKKRGNLRLDTLLHLDDQMEMAQEDLFLPPDYQQKRQEDAKAHLLQLKRLLEGME